MPRPFRKGIACHGSMPVCPFSPESFVDLIMITIESTFVHYCGHLETRSISRLVLKSQIAKVSHFFCHRKKSKVGPFIKNLFLTFARLKKVELELIAF